MQNGYSSGYEAGIHARKTRHSNNYRDHSVYRDGNRGYDRAWGSPTLYRQGFQAGYAIGYSDGYYGRDWQPTYGNRPGWVTTGPSYTPPPRPYGYSNPYDWRQRATYFGYYDGYYRGQYDRQQGYKVAKPTGHGAYETAANGWSEDLCELYEYQGVYRNYFVAGYRDGFGRKAYNKRYHRNW
jgi:hypothetical protein